MKHKIINFLCKLYPNTILQEIINTSPLLVAKKIIDSSHHNAQIAHLIHSENLRHSTHNLHDTNISQETLDLLLYASGTTPCYGQEGEDLILKRLLGTTRTGFYIDIGAHHPIRLSNTYSLYRLGWHGINIDATPGSMALFETLRSKDINLECAISSSPEPRLFYIFKEGALNTFDSALAEQYTQQGWPLAETREITPRPLVDLLNEHLPKNQAIDFMNIDVEGQEMEVLKSNDWMTYKPGIIAIELLETSLSQLYSHPVVEFLERRGYTPVAKLFNTTILQLVA